MNRIFPAAIFTTFMLASCSLSAQEQQQLPPQNALKLSEIVAKIEQRNDFRYVSEIEWNREGYYDITYFTGDKAKVEIKIDAVSGQPR